MSGFEPAKSSRNPSRRQGHAKEYGGVTDFETLETLISGLANSSFVTLNSYLIYFLILNRLFSLNLIIAVSCVG